MATQIYTKANVSMVKQPKKMTARAVMLIMKKKLSEKMLRTQGQNRKRRHMVRR